MGADVGLQLGEPLAHARVFDAAGLRVAGEVDQGFEELRDLLDMAYRQFYWRPKFVARNLFQIRNLTDFKRKATAGLRLLAG